MGKLRLHVLVINPGSSSIKFSVFAESGGGVHSLAEGEVGGIGGGAAKLEFRDADGKDLSGALGAIQTATMEDAIAVVERAIGVAGLPAPDAVGYRVVHPGPKLRGHQRLTAEVLAELRAAARFAPLHDPEALEIIDALMQRYPDVPNVACFDTVFHETMPYEATVYPLPAAVRDEGVRRYGFHGLSCESVVAQMREQASVEFPQTMLIAHLGSGCSVTACVDGKSVDTTMGLTPTGGVVMGTRPGDLDPGLVLYLLRREGATVDSVEEMLNHEAGLKGLCGINDMRRLEAVWHDENESNEAQDNAEVAFEVFTASVRRAIGGMAAVQGMDAIVFTGGIGEHDSGVRDAVASGLLAGQPLIDPWLNSSRDSGLRKVSMETSKIAIYVVPAEEDLMIARHVVRICSAIR